jgi:hemerythrin-like metal-binding protein
MTVIEWSQELKLGVPAMDAEHRRLLTLTNDFLDAASAGAPLSRLSHILGELIARTRIHFQAEETLLDRAGYPGLAGHRAAHERLLVDAQRLYERFAAPQSQPGGDQEAIRALTMEAAHFLQRWLVDHIVAEDMAYRPFVMRLT